MASDNPWARLREEATCAICWKYYTNPSILDCGHSFCADCISECWKEIPDNTACPQCRTAVERKNCRLNTCLANVVELAKQMPSFVKEGEVRKVCEKHPEPSGTAFCVRDQIVFCQVCEGSEQHRDHYLASVKETAQLYKGWYSTYVETLNEVRAQMVRNKFHILGWSENLQKNSVTEHQTIATVFKQLYDFLINQEDYLLTRFKSVTGEVADKRNRDLAHLCLDIFTLENNIRLLEEKASQPVHEFLRVRLWAILCWGFPLPPRESWGETLLGPP
ncbi:PREDICTED: zinc finger protein RFP-like [Gekko japonicus]|uniref:Zinc finger protein RFP-like n=1 Tax=Gekko japonicus TaxID=146911 RepID=A0ABM1JX02_GEKJA|nr:PREDICTED: zinc finger protein RFP-like [Gekko japonicus]